ncbi:MAG: nitrate/nitrite transporter NrtS [Pseudomonadales bacterium]
MSRSMAVKTVLRGSYLRRGFAVAAVVGTALNLINQPEALFGSAVVVWWKLLMTYCVPFLVASYGAYSALRSNPP